MSIHSSLKIRSTKEQVRSVLKRSERIKLLMSKGKWQKDSSVFGLPKVKVVRIKVKKEKATEKPLEATATSAPEAQSSPASPTRG